MQIQYHMLIGAVSGGGSMSKDIELGDKGNSAITGRFNPMKHGFLIDQFFFPAKLQFLPMS